MTSSRSRAGTAPLNSRKVPSRPKAENRSGCRASVRKMFSGRPALRSAPRLVDSAALPWESGGLSGSRGGMRGVVGPAAATDMRGILSGGRTRPLQPPGPGCRGLLRHEPRDQVQGKVDPAGDATGGEDVAVVDDAFTDDDGAGRGEVVVRTVMRRRAASLEKPG